MQKKIVLSVTLAASLAALAACGQPQRSTDYNVYADRDTAVCTDRKGKRVADRYCQRNTSGGASSAFLWYYLGRSSSVPYYGDSVRGGSYTRTRGATYFHAPKTASVTRSAAVSRGGLGSSARSSGSYGGSRGSVGG